MKRSPLAPKKLAALPQIGGVRLASFRGGGVYKNRDDVVLLGFDAPCAAAAVFTKSSVRGVPVDISAKHLKQNKGRVRGVLINAGCANVFTGARGVAAANRTAKSAAAVLGVRVEDILLASTGVIGEDLQTAGIVGGLKKIKMNATQDWKRAAGAIITTDTFPKLATRTATLGGKKIKLNAIAKGSGMIAPDMATLLSFIITDATLSPSVLQKLLREAVDETLNAISVDSDTSTSDSCYLFATGGQKIKGKAISSASDPRLKDFKKALKDLLQDIALQVICDGEGVSHVMQVEVSGAASAAAAKRIALSVGNSPLVKTALAGGDANWGRIIMAVGKAGERVVRDKISIDIGGHKVARGGRAVANYNEAAVSKIWARERVVIAINVGVSAKKNQARIWASDLTQTYIKINADYRS